MNICIFGDSIGWGATDPVSGGWATLLRNHYEEKEDSSVYNLSICGDTTSDLLKRFDVEAKARRPDLIIFAIGINDSRGINGLTQPHITQAQLQFNLTRLLRLARSHTTNVLFLGLTPIDDSKTAPDPWESGESYLVKNVQDYDLLIEKFCQKNKLPYIILRNVLTIDNLPDGLHPDTVGHQKIFQTVLPVVEKMLL